MKAIATYLRVVAALDRYHELAAGPPPRRSPEAPPLALPTPPKALTFVAPPADEAFALAHISDVGLSDRARSEEQRKQNRTLGDDRP